MPRKVYYRTQDEYDGFIWCSKVINYGVSLTVISAINNMYCSKAYLLDRKDLFKFLVKKYCNTACSLASKRECQIKNNVASKTFWLDYSDIIIDKAESDITAFRIAIKQVLDDNNIPDSDIISYTETARVLADVSIKQYDGVIYEAKQKYGYDYNKYFNEYRINDVYFQWHKMCCELYGNRAVDLNTDSVTNAFDAMFGKFINGDYIDECINEILKEHPEFIKTEAA